VPAAGATGMGTLFVGTPCARPKSGFSLLTAQRTSQSVVPRDTIDERRGREADSPDGASPV